MGGVLDGKVAVVTGTSPNIGAGLALALAESGASIACLDSHEESAKRCAAAIVRTGRGAIGLRCDVTDESAVRGALARAEQILGPVTTLVNAAAIFNMKGISEMSTQEWRRQIDIILTGAFICTKVTVEAMRQAGTGGSIVCLTSSAAHQGEPGNIAYATAKAGLLNFARSVAMDVARFGIRVNTLSPTATDPRPGLARAKEWDLPTPEAFDDPAAVDSFLAEVTRKVPLGALPTPRDYGDALVFLVSDAARMITGADLRVDAGTVAKYWRWDPGPGDISGPSSSRA
jgi:NAD(P)-dependent dehydrogenase (short-subunit alcohol dehydrogenase family)